LACGAISAAVSYGESITGVVYSNEIGNGIHPAGRIELAVGSKVYSLEYGEPIEKRFSRKSCYDIGAVWSAMVERSDDSLHANRLSCTGRVDEGAHGPWLLVRDYLEGLPNSVSPSAVFSARYRSSPEFQRFVALIRDVDLNFYYDQSDTAKCLKIVSVAPRTQTRVEANCAVELQGKTVALLFDVVRNKGTGRWEIDGIKVD
jgi:hypothetical protein